MSPGMRITTAKTVDEYIALAPMDMQRALKDLRKAIREAAPEAEEGISYHMPSYRYHGWLVFFGAYKEHLSLFAVGEANLKKFRGELRPFEISGQTIHFTPEKPLPAAHVKRIVKARMKENELRAKLRKNWAT